MVKRYVYSEEFKHAVSNSYSCAETIRAMGWSKANASYLRFHRWIKEYNIDTSHFRRNGPPGTSPGNKRSNDEVFVLGKEENGNALKKRLFSLGWSKKCDTCGLTHWRGIPIMLELDHINGERTDNRIENLRILCPNCHAQTETYRGKNIILLREKKHDNNSLDR